MGHSFIEAHESEELAFEAFTRANPRRVTLLLDTYDVLQAAKTAARLGLRLRSRGLELDAVRLDSGDLAAQAKEVRRILDAAGLSSVRIFASGDLDEWELRGLLSCGAPIDGFGIGTRLATSADAPYLDSVYKLQEYAGKPRRKRSQGKQTWPGRKQVWRHSVDGRLVGDLVALESEAVAGTLLLEPVMESGRRAAPGPRLEEIRQRVRRQLQALPEELRSLEGARTPYPVNVSTGVHALADSLDARLSLTTS
jgi:nicotinate phosphoribosyltransferase